MDLAVAEACRDPGADRVAVSAAIEGGLLSLSVLTAEPAATEPPAGKPGGAA